MIDVWICSADPGGYSYNHKSELYYRDTHCFKGMQLIRQGIVNLFKSSVGIVKNEMLVLLPVG